GDHRFRRIVAAEEGSLRIHEFERGDDPSKRVWAVWSPTGSGMTTRRVLPRLPGRFVRAEVMPLAAGWDQRTAVPVTQREDGSVEIEVSESPLYVLIDAGEAAVDGVAGDFS